MDPDRQLVSEFLARRSEEAFAALYRRHGGAVYGLAVRLAGTTAADDIAQDAWIRAIAGLAAFRGESSLRTWLCGIVVNCCRERWRKDGVELTEAVPDSGTRRDAGASLDVRAALARLPAGYRAVVVLHDLFGYTHLEIAGMLAIEAGTSKSQLSRGRTALRALLKGISHVER